jgi:hypothetical protein
MGQPANEQENCYTCPACRQRVDARDLRQVMWHERPEHEPLEKEKDEETRKQDGKRLGVLIGLVIVVAVFVYVTGIGY